MYVLQVSLLLPLTALSSSLLIIQLCLKKSAVCYTSFLFFGRVPTTPHLAESRMSHSVAGPGLLVSSMVASKSAGTKLTFES